MATRIAKIGGVMVGGASLGSMAAAEPKRKVGIYDPVGANETKWVEDKSVLEPAVGAVRRFVGGFTGAVTSNISSAQTRMVELQDKAKVGNEKSFDVARKVSPAVVGLTTFLVTYKAAAWKRAVIVPTVTVAAAAAAFPAFRGKLSGFGTAAANGNLGAEVDKEIATDAKEMTQEIGDKLRAFHTPLRLIHIKDAILNFPATLKELPAKVKQMGKDASGSFKANPAEPEPRPEQAAAQQPVAAAAAAESPPKSPSPDEDFGQAKSSDTATYSSRRQK